MGRSAGDRVGSWGRSRVLLALVGVATGALLASCTPPSEPAPPGPPVISFFAARAERTEAPVNSVLTWSLRDPNGDALRCRVDTTGDGAFDRVLDPCRSVDTVFASFDTAGVRTLTLEVDDGDFPPVSAQTTIDVADGPSEDFEITLRLDPSMREEFREAFTDAATRWQEVIVAGVPDQPLQLPAGLLGWVPAYDGVVDDILIDARDIDIDGPGKILGRAGGLLIRQEAWQPYWGIMEFDTADLDSLAASGRLGDVILHEMGHVLGLGANWILTGSLTDVLTDPAYTGRAGVAAHQELGGRRYVPVENEGQWGTVLGHWRESTFDDELMTGFLGTGEQPLSRLTVGALADLGYGVDLGAADPYAIPSAAGLRQGGDHDGHDHEERLHTQAIEPFFDGVPGT